MSQGDQDKTESPGGVQSVDRAISVLEILARRGSAGVSEVAEEIGVHKSTAFRLLGALEDRGLVEQATDRGKYQLGFGILRLASAIPRRLDLVRQGRPVLDELATAFGETVNLAVIRSHYAVNVDQAVGSAAVAAQNWTGQLTPLHATSSGKVLLAHQTPAARKQLLDAAKLARFTEHTLTSRRALDQQLEAALSNGYATTFEEYEDGLNAVAAAVRDHTGEVVAAVSVSGPAYRLDQERIAGLVDDLKAGVDQISERMGFLS
ncbi:IclR family transcriptional regulator [Acidothermaceae bacterium B102]|nr:IclR family transcriptional regulator [Acidothermaceae bacterium B102]